MSLKLSLEPNEQIIFQDEIQADKYTKPFFFAVTNQAIFILREKHFAKESWYLDKVSFSRIKQVSLQKERQLWIWGLAALLLSVGLIMSFLMMKSALYQEPGARVSGVPFAIAVCGLVLPFLTKGRKVLNVKLDDGLYKWKPQLMVDKKSREKIKKIQQDILLACHKVGILIFEEK